MAASKSNTGVLALIIVAFTVLVVGMGLGGAAGVAMTVLSIFMFIVAIVMSIAGSKSSSGDKPPPAAPPPSPPPPPPAGP